jgi:RNA polymerase sigma factor (sigma-70 family)
VSAKETASHLVAPGVTTTQLAAAARQEPLSANVCHAALFERVEGRIRRYFLKKVWDAEEAEDLAQRTYLELTRSLRSGAFDPGRSFNVWLWMKVHATFVDWCRALRRRLRPLDDCELVSPSPEPMIDQRLDANAILAALERRLGSEGYEIFVFYYEAGLTTSEIAEMVGRDRKTIAKRLEQARDLLERLDAGRS